MVPQLASWGLVDRVAAGMGRVVLTQRGRLLADAVVRELLV
jgi:oxygen-independent coproporphyrinogen-3 oxidase